MDINAHKGSLCTKNWMHWIIPELGPVLHFTAQTRVCHSPGMMAESYQWPLLGHADLKHWLCSQFSSAACVSTFTAAQEADNTETFSIAPDFSKWSHFHRVKNNCRALIPQTNCKMCTLTAAIYNKYILAESFWGEQSNLTIIRIQPASAGRKEWWGQI